LDQRVSPGTTYGFNLEADCEIVWLQIVSKHYGNLLFGIYYHLPGFSVDILNKLSNLILMISSYGFPILLCGDFNVPNID